MDINEDKDHGRAVSPVPQDVEIEIPKHPLGKPSVGWEYKDQNGNLLFVVARFQDEDGQKSDRPLTYRKFNDGTYRWSWKGLESPRPIYNLDKIYSEPKATVIVVEGEKAAEAASIIFPDMIVTTSPNGAGSAHKSDWSHLKGRKIVIWPDHDDEGLKYAEKVANLCMGIKSQSVHIAKIPENFPEKWDLADDFPEGTTKKQLVRILHEAEKVLSPYEKVMERVELLNADFCPDNLDSVMADVSLLNKFEQRKAMNAVRAKTKIPLYLQKQAIQEHNSSDREEPDQLDLARQVIRKVGSENILSTTAHVWNWSDLLGVWSPLDDLALKQIVQKALEEYGCEISRGLVDAVTSILKNEIYQEDVQWDLNPHIINAKNGELHLIGGKWELRPHNRENYRTTILPVPYDTQADCPRFEAFLDEIFYGDKDALEKKRVILELIGYSLTNTAMFEKFIILVGNGANGKSVLLEVINALVGSENAAAVQPAEFGNKFQRAYLHRKLVNIVSELKQGGKIQDAALKAITSGENNTAEHKNKPPFSFKPYCTCWFGTNHMPHTDDFSDATFRRAVVLEFNNKFEEGKNADPKLKETLLEELPGIMRISLNAYADALKNGAFTKAPSSEKAKLEWRTQEDQVAQFIYEMCELDLSYKTPTADVYRVYRGWAEEQGIRKELSKNPFSTRLKYHNCELYSGTKGVRMVKGLRLKRQLH